MKTEMASIVTKTDCLLRQEFLSIVFMKIETKYWVKCCATRQMFTTPNVVPVLLLLSLAPGTLLFGVKQKSVNISPASRSWHRFSLRHDEEIPLVKNSLHPDCQVINKVPLSEVKRLFVNVKNI